MVKFWEFLKKFYLGILLLFLYLPILMMMVFSFNQGKSMARWTGFTFDWYAELFRDPTLMESLGITLSVAILSSLIAVVIGTMAAIAISEYRPLAKSAVINITYIPMTNADIVTGISMLLLFIFLKIPRGYGTLLIAHVTFNIPYVIFSVLPKLRQLDRYTYEAALDLGAKPSYALRKVIIPEIMPGIVSGAIMAFTMSFDDFVISYFTTQGMVSNLSIYIYSMARVGINPKINALSTIMFICIVTLLVVSNVKSWKTQKNRNKMRSRV